MPLFGSSSGSDEPEAKFTELPQKIMEKFQPMLLPGEKIEMALRGIAGSHVEGSMAVGSMGGMRGMQTTRGEQVGHPWLVITSQRLFLLSTGLISFESRQFTWDKINSIEFQQGVVEDRIVITGMGVNEIWTFWKKLRQTTQQLVQAVNQKIASAAEQARHVIIDGGGAQKQDPLAELKMRLVKGEITPDEYQKLKTVLES